MLRIEQYQDASGGWRWRGVDGNNRIICDGSESYITATGIDRAIENVMTEFRADVQIIRKDKRRKTAAAPGKEDEADRRGIGVAGYEIIAEYAAEGAHEVKR